MKKRADGRYQKKITLPNGSKKTLYSSAANERLAQKDFTEQILKIDKLRKQSTLFSAIAEQWKEEHFPRLQNNTLKGYKSAYKGAITYFKDIPVSEVKPLTIQRYVDYLNSQKFATKTIKNKLLVVSLIMKYAVLLGVIELDPTTSVRLPDKSKGKKRDQANEIDQDRIFASTDKDFGILALFMLLTGCRKGEALALTPTDVDTRLKVVHITKTVEWIGQKPQIKPTPKTNAGVRDIPLNDDMIELLKPLMKDAFLFPSSQGGLMPESQFERRWKKYQTETNVRCTPHQLRHAYATILFDAGIDVKTAQRWLGHSDIKTTLDIYTHLSNSRLEKSVEAISSFIGSRFSKSATK